MNCAASREMLVSHAEGVLAPDDAAGLERHLATCAGCRAEQQAVDQLQRRLFARARSSAGVALAAPVMSRIHATTTGAKRRTAEPAPTLRWLFVLGTAAGAFVILALVALSPGTKAQAAVDVMNRGIVAAARLTTVHLQARLRAAPHENFSSFKATADFSPIELWKEFDGQKRWRVEKPGRVAVMDGESTLLFIRSGNTALRVPKPTANAFDTGWLHLMADIEQTLTHALKMAESKGWKMELTKTTDAAGVVHANVTIDAVTGVPPGDYLTNKFFDVGDTRRVYRFDDTTGALESVQVYLRQESDLLLIFEVTGIEYNQPISPSVFQLQLPDNVAWMGGLQPVANNSVYAVMTAPQAARAFFEACSRENWTETAMFLPMPVTEPLKQALGGLTLLSLGEPFTSAATPAQFVPYEIQLRNGQVRKHNLALKKHPSAGRWIVDGGI